MGSAATPGLGRQGDMCMRLPVLMVSRTWRLHQASATPRQPPLAVSGLAVTWIKEGTHRLQTHCHVTLAGTVSGKFVEVPRLDPAAMANIKEPVVLLVRTADGDEEVGSLGGNLRGIVLLQELPHLSHLGAPRHGMGCD